MIYIKIFFEMYIWVVVHIKLRKRIRLNNTLNVLLDMLCNKMNENWDLTWIWEKKCKENLKFQRYLQRAVFLLYSDSCCSFDLNERAGTDLLHLIIVLLNTHRIIQSFGLEWTLKIIYFQSCHGTGTPSLD